MVVTPRPIPLETLSGVFSARVGTFPFITYNLVKHMAGTHVGKPPTLGLRGLPLQAEKRQLIAAALHRANCHCRLKTGTMGQKCDLLRRALPEHHLIICQWPGRLSVAGPADLDHPAPSGAGICSHMT